MRRLPAVRSGWPAVALASALSAGMGPARAGLFDDDEARRAILDLRSRIEQSEQASKARDDALREQIGQLQRSLLDLNTAIEQLRTELARQRGNDEQLQRDVTTLQRDTATMQRDVAELQRRQGDVQQGLDDRLRRIEPQKVVLDGKEFLAEPDETRLYGEAVGVLRQGDFGGAVAAFGSFMRRYPASGYGHTAHYWLANAHYGKRDYKEAITAFRTLVTQAPQHPRAAEALLAIANCQIELKDSKTARRTLDELIKAYPGSEAAQAGRQRLASLK